MSPGLEKASWLYGVRWYHFHHDRPYNNTKKLKAVRKKKGCSLCFTPCDEVPR